MNIIVLRYRLLYYFTCGYNCMTLSIIILFIEEYNFVT